MASSPGTVVWVGWGLFTETPGNDDDPYGLAVVIRHDFGYNNQKLYTVYAHMSKTIATHWSACGNRRFDRAGRRDRRDHRSAYAF